MNSEIFNTYTEDLGTAVLYGARPLYPEVANGPDRGICEDLASSKYFLYSSSLTSEYIDFAKYEFKFNLQETDFWSYLLPNLYDNEVTTKVFGDNFDEEVSTVLVPQLSGKDIQGGEPDRHYFGKLDLPEGAGTVYLLRLPRDIWKVEFYSPRLKTNHGGEDFWEYSVFGSELEVIPDVVVTLGPGPWPRISDIIYDGKDLSVFPNDYAKRYQLDGKNFLEKGSGIPGSSIPLGYMDFEDVMDGKEYSKIYQEEISSEKMLYVVVASNGAVSEINLFSSAYTQSKNRHRHLNKNVLRNDEIKLGTTPRVFAQSRGMVFDSRSKTLLGVMTSGDTPFPILREKYESLPADEYSQSSISGVSGKFVTPRELSVLGEIPEISPFWIPEESLKTGSHFNKYYILSSGKGEVSPFGVYYLKTDTPLVLTVTPKHGYSCTGYGIKPDSTGRTATSEGSKYTFTGLKNEDTITIIFQEIIYRVRLKLFCPNDYTNYGEDTSYFQENYGDQKILLWYYDYETEEEVLYSGETLTFKDTEPFKFKISLESSLYYFGESHQFFCQGKELPRTEEGYNVLTVDPGLSEFDSQEIEVLGTLECRKYNIKLETASEVQLNGKNATLDFGSSYKAQFAYEDGRDLTRDDIRVFNLDTELFEESSDVWKIGESRNGKVNIVTFEIPSRDRDSNPDGGVRNNYIIFVGYEDQ